MPLLPILPIERDIYRERYAMEFDRRGQINDRADAQVTLVTIFVGIVSYYILNFPVHSLSWLFFLFVVAFSFLCAGTILAGICVGWVIWDDTTSYLPSPSDSHDYCQKLVRWHLRNDPINGQKLAEQALADQFDEDLLLAADANAKRNDFRDYRLYWSKRFIFVALIGFLAAAAPHMWLSGK